MTESTAGPASVTVLIPTFQEASAIDTCLEAIARQTHPGILETLVIDGGSDDGTQALAAAHPGVRVLDNPQRIQAAALNIGIAAAQGDVIVRVDGHCIIADDYVERCVAALEESGAAMVGGGMTPVAHGPVQQGIADAMASRFGAGPARFHTGGEAGWVDTVYLGAYRRDVVRAAGGYAADMEINEDAELAHRLQDHGGIWFDPSIRSVYEPRSSLGALAKQFFRYGRGRAATATRHPGSVKPRQLVAPGLLLAIALLPRRRWTLSAYLGGVAVATTVDGNGGLVRRATYALALPTMHACWGAGFLVGLVTPSR